MANRGLRRYRLSARDIVLGYGPDDAGRRLDFYDVPTRYPDAFPEGSASEHFTDADVAQAKAAVEEVFAWAKRQLPELDRGPNN